ncbi:MAG: hypothetical protein VB137_16230 [Burkholderia sp.]
MSHTISATGKPFGLQWVCQVLDFPRSTIYAKRARALNKVTPLALVQRGPKPKVPDHELLAAVRTDLTRTPVRRRRGAQGLGTFAHSGRHPRVPRPCLAADARTQPAFAPSATAETAQCSRWSNDD